MDQPRSWYKKKRFLIPLGLVGLFTSIAVASNNPQPTALQSEQTASSVQSNVKAPESTITPLDLASPVVEEKVTAPKTAPAQTATTSDLSNNNYYQNVDGNSVHSPAYAPSIPAGASAQCGDGTYSFSQNRRGTCSHHGGVAQWY